MITGPKILVSQKVELSFHSRAIENLIEDNLRVLIIEFAVGTGIDR
jgi:hypothetical protein